MHARNAHYSAIYAHRSALPATSYTNAEAADIVQRLADRLSATRSGTHVADKCLVDLGRDLARGLRAWA